MRKIFLVISFLVSWAISYSQNSGFPQNPTTGAVNINQTNIGSITARKGISGGTYRDTVQANSIPYVKSKSFNIIHTSTDDNTWYRSSDTLRWVLLAITSSNCGGTRLIDGSITWSGTGYSFNATVLHYGIICGLYTSDTATLVVNPSDPTFGRFDVFYADTSGNVGIIQGTPSANPVKPSVNPISQIEISFVFVPAGSVTPPQTATTIYNENIEWATASNISGIDFAYPTNPYDGLVSTLVPLMTAPFDFLSYQNGSVLNINNYQYLKLYLRRNSALGSDPPSELIFTFYNGATQVTSSVFLSDGAYGYDGSVIGSYQLITIPISAFTLADSLFDKLYITNTFGSLSSFQLDKIYLLGNVPPPPVISNSWNINGNASTNPALNYVGTSDSTQLNIGRNGNFDLIIPDDGINLTADTSKHILVRDPVTNKMYWIYQPSIFALGCLKIYDSTSAGITRKYIRDTCSSGSSALQYNWVEQFDDAIIGANQVDGIDKSFTLTHTPLDSLAVFLNGIRQKQGQDYTYNGTTGITFIDTVLKKDFIVVAYNYSSAQPSTNRYYQGQTNNVVFYGNSLFYGVGAVHGFSDAVTQESNFLPTVGFHNVNRGINGITTPQLTADITDSLVPYLSTSYASNIILVCEGTNQIAVGASAATAYADLVTLCNTIKGLDASYKVIICTILPGNPTVDETKRLAVNANIVANYATFADGLVDFSTNSYIGDAGDNRNQTYYANDSLHLRPEGYYQMATSMYSPIMAQAGIATQNITRVLLPQNNEYAVIGGNYSDTATTNMIIGTQRPIQVSFMTDAKQRGRFDSIGRFILDATILTRTPSDTLVGVNLKPNITGNNAGTVYDAVQIGGTFSNFNNGNFFQLRIKDNNSSTIIEVPSVKTAYSTANLYALRGFNTNIISPALTINSDLNLTNFTTGGLVFSTGGTATTGNAVVIGYNSNKLIYNLSTADAHSFRAVNIERFAVGYNNQVYGGYGANLSATNAFNVDGSTTGGFVGQSPGGQPDQIHLMSGVRGWAYETNTAGYHRFYNGTIVNFEIANGTIKGAIASGAGTKAVRYNPSTKEFTYADTTAAGGGGTVTNVSGTAGRIDVATGTTTPVIDISSSYVGQSSITTVGTLATGAVPASLITAGTFGTGTYTFTPSGNRVGLNLTGQSLTGSDASKLLNITGTWNTSGNPTAIFANITNTASGASTLLMDLQASGVSQFALTKTGGLTIPGNITANSGVFTGQVRAGAAQNISWDTRSIMTSPSDGNILFTNRATTSFTGLSIGGTTSSFPQIRLNGTGIDFKLADNSAFTATQDLYNRFGSGSPESSVTAPVGAIYHRTDGGANTSLYVKESGSGNTGWVAK